MDYDRERQRLEERRGQDTPAEASGPQPTQEVASRTAPDLLAPVREEREVQAEAAAGVRGGGGALPYLDTIQQAFGRHDLSAVQAHTGPDAQQAAARIGARAYATGGHVAFAGAPDLFTAAHEAAHVVQQREGVQLRAVVGRAGDAHEQHADAVAARVVAGRSAEPLLDRGPGRVAPGLQRVEDEEEEPEAEVEVEAEAETEPTPAGSATVVGAAAETEWAFDKQFTPGLIEALQKNPNLSLDEVLVAVSNDTFVPNNPDQKYMHPTIFQYGQTKDNTAMTREGERSAVLVANNNYKAVSKLATPIAEAGQLESALKGKGFKSGGVQKDQSGGQMSSHYDDLVSKAKPGDDIVAYFAGHGSAEGLCGVNHWVGGNADLYSNAQVASAVSAATAKGVHIRFIMDSCHSGAAVQTVRKERVSDLAWDAFGSQRDELTLAVAQTVMNAKAEIVKHTQAREAALGQIDQQIAAHMQAKPPALHVTALIKYHFLLAGLRSARSKLQANLDGKANQLWAALRGVLLGAVPLLAKLSGKKIPPPPVKILEHRTMGGIVDYLDVVANATIGIVDRRVSEGEV